MPPKAMSISRSSQSSEGRNAALPNLQAPSTSRSGRMLNALNRSSQSQRHDRMSGFVIGCYFVGILGIHQLSLRRIVPVQLATV